MSIGGEFMEEHYEKKILEYRIKLENAIVKEFTSVTDIVKMSDKLSSIMEEYDSHFGLTRKRLGEIDETES